MVGEEAGAIVVERLREHAQEQGWSFDAAPYGNGYRAVVQRGPERAVVTVTRTGLVHVPGPSSALGAAILVWKAGMPSYARAL